MRGRRDAAATSTGVARRQPQTAYALVQRVTPDIGMTYHAVEDESQDTTFLPALFGGTKSRIPGRAIAGPHVKTGLYRPPLTRLGQQ